MDTPLYIGLMSGTSLDAIDAVVADFDSGTELLATLAHPFPLKLRHQLQDLIGAPAQADIADLGHIDRELANAYADAVGTLLTASNIQAASIGAIGCHGQTVCHKPDGPAGFSLQLGNSAALAAASGIPVVNDFRSADIALGGQGAPLVPAFHQHVFAAKDTNRVIVNIGGIANITLLPANGAVSGYDTGPGNTLLDLWCAQHLGKPHDDRGQWAATEEPDLALLETLLTDSYFATDPPKSTGREYFNSDWLNRYLGSIPEQPQPAAVQATLAELTAGTIATAILNSAPGSEVYLCGGGAHNADLVTRIAARLGDHQVADTSRLGIEPDWVEAAAFAWLARARLQNEPGNLPAVTGASRAAVLGALHQP